MFVELFLEGVARDAEDFRRLALVVLAAQHDVADHSVFGFVNDEVVETAGFARVFVFFEHGVILLNAVLDGSTDSGCFHGEGVRGGMGRAVYNQSRKII